MTFKKFHEHYSKPTNVTWRKVGDALLGVALMGIPAQLASYTWLSITMFIIGIVGKFITNLFKND